MEHETEDFQKSVEQKEQKPPKIRTGSHLKPQSRKKAQRIFYENLPLAAKFNADLLKRKHDKENPITPDELKLLAMQKDAADTIVAYGLGRPGTQSIPKPNLRKVPLIELDLGDIDKLKKEHAGSTENESL